MLPTQHNISFVLYHPSLELCLSHIDFIGYGTNNRPIYRAILTNKLDQALIRPKKLLNNRLLIIKKYMILGSNDEIISINEFLITPVKITYQI